jgi:hypothetical protein
MCSLFTFLITRFCSATLRCKIRVVIGTIFAIVVRWHLGLPAIVSVLMRRREVCEDSCEELREEEVQEAEQDNKNHK